MYIYAQHNVLSSRKQTKQRKERRYLALLAVYVDAVYREPARRLSLMEGLPSHILCLRLLLSSAAAQQQRLYSTAVSSQGTLASGLSPIADVGCMCTST